MCTTNVFCLLIRYLLFIFSFFIPTGDFGYQTLSYFTNSSNLQTDNNNNNNNNNNKIPSTSSLPINIKNSHHHHHHHNGTISSMSPNSSLSQQNPSSNGFYRHHRNVGKNGSGNVDVTNGFHNEIEKENNANGTIMIRDLERSRPSRKVNNQRNNSNSNVNNKNSNNKEPNIIAHFTPHTHPVGYLSFNPSGTYLYSTSTQGHQFHVFEVFGHNRYCRMVNGS